MRMSIHLPTFLSFILVTLSSISSLFGQKVEGVYIGAFENKYSGVVELVKSSDLITGVIQTSLEKKWFFYGLIKGTTFDNHDYLNLGDSPYVKGEIKLDTLYLEVNTKDSSYWGVFLRVKKKKAEQVIAQTFQSIPESRDMNLVGEWICIDDTAPEKYRTINWKMTLLESGISVPDYEYARQYYLKKNAEMGFKVKSAPTIKINATWYTKNGRQFVQTHESSNSDLKEFVSTYELKNDTLRLTSTSINKYTSTFIRVKKKNSD